MSETTDTDRIEYIERMSCEVWVFDPPSGDAWVWSVTPTYEPHPETGRVNGVGDTLRAAVDDAMARFPLAEPPRE